MTIIRADVFLSTFSPQVRTRRLSLATWRWLARWTRPFPTTHPGRQTDRERERGMINSCLNTPLHCFRHVFLSVWRIRIRIRIRIICLAGSGSESKRFGSATLLFIQQNWDFVFLIFWRIIFVLTHSLPLSVCCRYFDNYAAEAFVLGLVRQINIVTVSKNNLSLI